MISKYDNVGTIMFVYSVPSTLMNESYEKIIDLSWQLKDDQDRYVLVGMEEYPLLQICASPQVLFDDMLKFPDQDLIWKAYGRFMDKYGPDVVDKYIVKDISSIKKMILNTIVFALDDLYKSDNMVVEFTQSFETYVHGIPYKEIISIPNLLYSVIQENFTIIDQNLIDKTNYIYFKKRSE